MTTKRYCEETWAILGLGSIGSLWASRFIDKQVSVELLLRDEKKVAQLKTKGLTIRHNGESKTYHPTLLCTPSHPRPAITHLLITTKAHQTLPALQSFSHHLSPCTHLILLQNGMGVAEKIKQCYPKNPLFLGVTTDGAYRSAPDTVVFAGEGETWFGPANGSKLEALSALKTVYPICQWEANIYPRIWQKFAINCAINALTVLYQCKNGALLHNQDAHLQLTEICSEIEALFNKKNIPLSEPLLKTVLRVADTTADNVSSMLQDFRAKRPLELAHLNGHLCKEAARLGIKAPANLALVNEIDTLIASSYGQ